MFQPHFNSTTTHRTETKPPIEPPPPSATITEQQPSEVRIKEDDTPMHSDKSTLIGNDDKQDKTT